MYFYPRPPRGGRHVKYLSDKAYGKFLSTPSARRATQATSRHLVPTAISIHALREEGDLDACDLMVTTSIISIHALREEGDNEGQKILIKLCLFLSTPSARRAT